MIYKYIFQIIRKYEITMENRQRTTLTIKEEIQIAKKTYVYISTSFLIKERCKLKPWEHIFLYELGKDKNIHNVQCCW